MDRGQPVAAASPHHRFPAVRDSITDRPALGWWECLAKSASKVSSRSGRGVGHRPSALIGCIYRLVSLGCGAVRCVIACVRSPLSVVQSSDSSAYLLWWRVCTAVTVCGGAAAALGMRPVRTFEAEHFAGIRRMAWTRTRSPVGPAVDGFLLPRPTMPDRGLDLSASRRLRDASP